MAKCSICRREVREGARHACLGVPRIPVPEPEALKSPDHDATMAPNRTPDRFVGTVELGPISDGLKPGTEVAGYIVDRQLGEGGMSVVYGATHPLIGKRAAIKVLRTRDSASAVERFLQEARAVNQIGHPNIVDVFQFGVLADGRHYLVMEYLAGETLGDLLERQSPSLQETVAILLPVCRALDAAHDQGIVHRDLKPDNVFMVSMKGHAKPVPKLIDFGIAKLLDDERSLALTDMGDIIGTPKFLSPEQAKALPEIDHRADIYSLGVMAFLMLTGRLPFDAERTEQLIAMHIHHPAPSPRSYVPELPAALDALILQMLEKDPEQRPTLAEVRQVLESVSDG